QVEVSILASIVQQETNRNAEKPVIAGVYLNRLKKGMRLDADPTLVYALGDFTITRVLNIHKTIDSPYNTYLYAGLPPGPICLPTPASIDAVLNYQAHNYYYFCARDDFSGYHAFAATYLQHLVNARRFQKALDRRGIRN
ncbi:MAG TPA: endolytic transglycosylase MltG, partial [Bacteroidia bacterium]|nr:endolytic transglycosylase MltG [Bacteroidia bacterium]